MHMLHQSNNWENSRGVTAEDILTSVSAAIGFAVAVAFLASLASAVVG